jgi:6-pyruvoyltetrahydropterin/6-carboxytetrahydropterin synthase
MMTRLAMWWLEWQGYLILPRTFVGVVLGNDILGLENPTAELISAWFMKQIPAASRVRVYETKDCWAEVTA